MSRPILPPLSGAEAELVATPTIGRVSAAPVECAAPSEELEAACEQELELARELILATGIFTSLDADAEEADVAITLIPAPRRPYWTKPAHNPAALLLSIAIPFWWSDSFGQQLLVEQKRAGRCARIDMRREGTAVMWGLAPLFNLSRSRAFMPDLEREAAHLRLHLVRFLRRDSADVECAA